VAIKLLVDEGHVVAALAHDFDEAALGTSANLAASLGDHS
jgi:hypothetical protein